MIPKAFWVTMGMSGVVVSCVMASALYLVVVAICFLALNGHGCYSGIV